MAPEATPNRRTVVLVAHGSRNPAAQRAHEALVESVAARIGSPGSPGAAVTGAYLEMAEPGIGEAIDSAVAAGATEVSVLPCFLHPGNHVMKDIPAIVEEASLRHAGVEISTTGHLGAEPALVEVLAGMVDDQ